MAEANTTGVKPTTSPFLEYELLTPETADPVVIRITGQKARGFPEFTANNGVRISALCPGWLVAFRKLWVRGNLFLDKDYEPVEIPLSDWPVVKQAIRELNEYYKEKDMKEDRYEFDLRDWHCESWGLGTGITLTRKKPRVKVEWKTAPSIYRSGAAYEQDDYGQFYIVQFQITRWDGEIRSYTKIDVDGYGLVSVSPKFKKTFISDRETEFERLPIDLRIGLDARGKWSTPVLLPESVYSRLDEITKALESRANGGKG